MPVLPIPSQELALVKRGLDAYHGQLRRLGITVEAPYMDAEYWWWGHWNDDAVEMAVGGPKDPTSIATCAMTHYGQGKMVENKPGLLVTTCSPCCATSCCMRARARGPVGLIGSRTSIASTPDP